MRKFPVSLSTALLMALLATGCGDQDDKATHSEDNNAVLITTTLASITDLPIWLDSVGQIHSKSAITLAAEVDGRITSVAVDAGEEIEQGQLLAETDTSTLLLQHQSAEASLDRLQVHIANGERRVGRFEKLSDRDLSSQTQVDDAREKLEAYRADYKAAVAQLAIVEDSLAKSRVTAPVSGVLQHRFIATGDFVTRGKGLFEITRPQQLQAWLPYPETSALRIRIGQRVEIRSPLVGGKVIEGTITELKPAIGPGSRSLMSITEIEDGGDLKPEATISGKVLVETRYDAVIVPEISVVRRPAGEVVYVITGNTASARTVTTGQRQSGLVEIFTGLMGNESIANEGASFLTDGATVRFMEPAS